MNYQKGFTLVEGLLIILIISVIGFAGYYVCNQQEKNPEISQNTSTDSTEVDRSTDEPSREPEISANWVRVTSGLKGFSVKIPDGMSGYNDSTSNFITVRSYSESNSSAVIENIEGYGSDAFSVLSIFQQKDPQGFSTTEKIDFTETSFTTNSGLVGVKQTFRTPYLPPCEGPGCYVGTEYINYELIDEETGLTTGITYSRRVLNEETARVYDLKAGDPDLSVVIEAVARSLQIN